MCLVTRPTRGTLFLPLLLQLLQHIPIPPPPPSPSPQELVVEQDSSCLYYVARALQSLQSLAGTIPHVKGKGEAACAVQRIAARMRQELGQDAPAAAGRGGNGGASCSCSSGSPALRKM